MIHVVESSEDGDSWESATLEEFMGFCDNAPWSFTFGRQLFSQQASQYRWVILRTLQNLGVNSSQFYILWNDMCDKNLVKVAVLCQKCPLDVLREASGIKTGGKWIEMVQKYFV